MQNSSSHHYACSTSQEIPCLLENLKGDDNYKTLHIKMRTQYTVYQSTIKFTCLLCWRLLCTEQPSTHSYHEPNKNNPILQSYFFQTLICTLSSEVSKVVPPVQVFYANFVFPPLQYSCYMPQMYSLLFYDYVHNNW
jgi:hypothetical protein